MNNLHRVLRLSDRIVFADKLSDRNREIYNLQGNL